jgi:hypothetical protein
MIAEFDEIIENQNESTGFIEIETVIDTDGTFN